MQSFNQSVFLRLNASAHPDAFVVLLAIFLAEGLIWTAPALIAIGWLRCSENTRKTLLVATVAGLAGLLTNQLVGLAWPQSRPIMLGLGHKLVVHAADPA
jgi:undecaprenyl-diphosphatase